MSRDWRRLLSLDRQPKTLRECYELVESFFADLSGPAPTQEELGDLDDRGDTARGARLGYLIAAARMIAGAKLHPSWVALERRLKSHAMGISGCTLLAVDDRSNPLDELARAWGMRKGLDSGKLVQIGRYGSS